MKILVVDDLAHQRATAEVQLGQDHELTVSSTMQEALKLIKDNQYDAVLTDLMMPAERDGGSNEYEKLNIGQPVPYGLVIALAAAEKGITKIAIVSNGQTTDGNHHNGPMLNAMDALENKTVKLAVGELRMFAGYASPHLDKASPYIVAGFEKYPYRLKDWQTVLGKFADA